MGVKLFALITILLLPVAAFAQPGPSSPPILPSQAIAVRCVNTLGTLFESCGGSGAAGTDVNIAGVGGVAVTTSLPISFVAPQHVVVDSATGVAVTNAGTFATQAAQSGTWNIGSVTTLPAITFASPQHTIVDSGAITFSNTTLAVTNTGTFAVQATLAAETTKVIGTVNIAAAQSIGLSGSLPAFAAIPSFKIDQTTPGTTNAVSVTNSFALEATLQSVKTAVETIDNFISGSRGLVTEDNSALIKTALDTLNAAVATAANQTTELGYLATIAALSKAEDGAHVDGETGVLSFGVRNDFATTLTSADLDRSPIAVDRHGHVNVRVMGQYGPTGAEQILQTSQAGVLLVITQPAATLPLPLCNAVRRYSCQPKNW